MMNRLTRSTFAAARTAILAVTLQAAVVATAAAQSAPFGEGWSLDLDASRLVVQSVKKNAIVETSEFAFFEGGIDADGVASIKVELNSIDTGIDLRNVRMRFLFFETFKYPQATITARVDPAALQGLAERRRVILPMDYLVDLHGVQKTVTAETVVTLIKNDQVSVASATPILIATELFGLDEGVLKLEEAASVDILPAGSISFDMVFNRIGGPAATGAMTVAAAPPTAKPAPARKALETAGEFSAAECIGRFEILSRTGSIFFKSGSAELDAESYPLLGAVLDIVQRCPSLSVVVAGHTDAIGSDAVNQVLSEARARSVANYLLRRGVASRRIQAVGYGETRPVAPNDTQRNRSRNRRIEFTANAG